MADVLQLARQCGGIDMLRYTGEPSGIIEMNEARLRLFRDAVLEEAAAACQRRADQMREWCDKHGFLPEMEHGWKEADVCAAAIRAMKGQP